MSPDRIKLPNRRRLAFIGLIAVTVAITVVATGIIGRAHSERALLQATDEAAIPTVALAKLQRGKANASLTLPGTIQPYQSALIYARVSGYLKDWEMDIGAHVKAGQVLASIDTPDLDQQLAQAQGNLATAQANAQLAGVTAQRWHALAGPGWVSKQANDEKTGAASATQAAADAAAANVRQLEALESFKTIVAPFDGVVTQRNTDVGALVNVGSGSNVGAPLFEVSDLHKVRVYVQVPQALTAGLTPGLTATFDLPQYPGQQFDATLVTTSRAMDPNSRSMLAELQADNPDGKFTQNSYIQVHFHLPADPNMVRLPATALVLANSGAQVAVLESGDKVAFKAIQIGRDFGDAVEVTAGLSAQDRVIDSPPETLQSGDRVRLASAAPDEMSMQVRGSLQ
jgi:RND family efflux transporter MFP subunit